MTSDSSFSSSSSRASTPYEIPRLYSCRWAWCRSTFISGEILADHVVNAHVLHAPLVKRKDIPMLRRIEQGIGESLSMDGMWGSQNAPSSLALPDTSGASQGIFANGATSRSEAERNTPLPISSPRPSGNHATPSPVLSAVGGQSPIPGLNHLETTPPQSPRSTLPKSPPFTTPTGRSFANFASLSSPIGTPSVSSLPPSPEFNSLVTNALTGESRNRGEMNHSQSTRSPLGINTTGTQFNRRGGPGPLNNPIAMKPPSKRVFDVSQSESQQLSRLSSTSSRGLVESQLTNAGDMDDADDGLYSTDPIISAPGDMDISTSPRNDDVDVLASHSLSAGHAEDEADTLSADLQWPSPLDDERNVTLEPSAFIDPSRLQSQSNHMGQAAANLPRSPPQDLSQTSLHRDRTGFPAGLRAQPESQTSASQIQDRSRSKSQGRSQSDSGASQGPPNLFRSGSLKVGASGKPASALSKAGPRRFLGSVEEVQGGEQAHEEFPSQSSEVSEYNPFLQLQTQAPYQSQSFDDSQ